MSRKTKMTLIQCAITGILSAVGLFILYSQFDRFILASIASSAFVFFSSPNAKTSSFRSVFGSYLIASIVGCMLSFIELYLEKNNISFFGIEPYIILCALAVSISMFFMLKFDVIHGSSIAFVVTCVFVSKPIEVCLFNIIVIAIIFYAKKFTTKHLDDLI